ncbi:MAG: hypothetical protein JHC31_05700 [Sulfurihydrogenibium sp.]|nr:hypothetical protein [Sulfurihydrogenibium sp.]
MKKGLEKVIVEGKELYFFYLGASDYFKPVYRVFVSKNLLKFDDKGAYVEFPFKGCELVKKDNYNLILKQGDKNCFIFEIESGFRGTAEIEEIDAYHHEYTTYKYDIYKSERGSTGVSKGVIMLTDSDKVKIKWKRDGRLYGKPAKGMTILHLNGDIEEIDRVESIDEIAKELE